MTVNASTFRLVAGGLVLMLVMLVTAIAVLAGLHDEIPTILENLATGALTALAALLVPPHSDEPTPVSVVGQPVAVTDAPAKKPTRRRRGDAGLTAVGLIVLVLVVLLLASVLGTTVHPLFWLILVLLVLAVLL